MGFFCSWLDVHSDPLTIFSAERPPGYDRVRNAEIGNKDFELDVLEEAYTTEHWLVRIYKVLINLTACAGAFSFSFQLSVNKSIAIFTQTQSQIGMNPYPDKTAM